MEYSTQLIGLSKITVVGHKDSHEGGEALVKWDLRLLERNWGIKSMDVSINDIAATLTFWDEETDKEYEEQIEWMDWDIDTFFYVSQGSIYPDGIIFDFNTQQITLEF